MDSNDRERVQEAKEELRKMVCIIINIRVCVTYTCILYMENHVHGTLAINKKESRHGEQT